MWTMHDYPGKKSCTCLYIFYYYFVLWLFVIIIFSSSTIKVWFCKWATNSRLLWGNFCPSTSGSTRWLCLKTQMLPMKDECECMSSY
jgi:hypothetical protein